MEATLDLQRFARVQAMAARGTPHERVNARARMEQMASRCGVSVQESLWKLDMSGLLTPDEPLSWPESTEETALHIAVKGLLHATAERPESLKGWASHEDGELPVEVRQALSSPTLDAVTIADAWTEFQAWNKVEQQRGAFDPGYRHRVFVLARIVILEERLSFHPAKSVTDIMARMDWITFLHCNDYFSENSDTPSLIEALREDVLRLSESGALSPPEAGPRNSEATDSAAERLSPTKRNRAAILSILRTPEGATMADREIARRVGVSPTTVGKYRKEVR